VRVPDVPFDTTKRDRASRTRRYFGWLGWPRTLSGRLALILVVGMLATQLVTGTVWFDARYGRVAEVPVRTGGARIADAVKLFDVVPVTERAALMARLRAAGIDVQPIGVPAPARTMEHFSDDLFDGVLRAQLGDEHPFVARPVVLYDDASEPLTLSTLLRANAPTAHLAADVQLRDGQWLSLAVVAGQAGLDLRPGAAFADYFVRIYLMRILAVVRGYPRTLRRCVQNLVDNAVRYAGGCRLSANLSPLGTHLEVVVEDRGPGIPEAELSAAVEPFVRAGGGRRGASSGVEAASFGPDSPESAEGVDGVDGVGLGLAIARTIAQAHDGTLMLSNRPGGGLRAVLSLPVDGPVTH
jgi:hypothetical protein